MFVEYVDTKVYSNIMMLICLFFATCLIFALRETHKIHWNMERCKRCERENWKVKYQKEIEKRTKRRHRLIATALTTLCMLIYLVAQKSRYTLQEEFAWTFEERYDAYGLYFAVHERKKPEEMLWYEKVLHLEWFVIEEGEDIGKALMNSYEKKVTDIFSAMPEKEDRTSTIEGGDSVFEERQQDFEALVDSNHKNLDSEELWKGYEDGVEVCRVYETSENVFQTGVLAESACENAYKSQRDGESVLTYTAGMVDQFEKFLKFRSRDAGEGLAVSEVEVCFRIEKGLYRASRENLNHDGRILEHCALYAYSCSQYAVEKTGIDDDSYLIYLDNSGLNCLNLLRYIDDGELCAELCKRELDRWACLESRNMSGYRTEGKTLDMVMDTKGHLEERLDGYRKSYE